MKINEGLKKYSDFSHQVKLDGGPKAHDNKMLIQGAIYGIGGMIFIGFGLGGVKKACSYIKKYIDSKKEQNEENLDDARSGFTSS